MANFKAATIVFVVLTLVFATTTVFYSTMSPSATTTTVTNTTTQTMTSTMTSTTTAAGGASSSGYTVNIAYAPGVGFYLVNGSGFALYFRSTDTPNSGTTTCTSTTCLKNWPPFYATNLNLPPGLNASSFGTITVNGYTAITTFDGYALFYWINDAAPGQMTGQGVGNFYVATLPTPTPPA